jgi:uncharacterized protein YbgA (DUF1722 family)
MVGYHVVLLLFSQRRYRKLGCLLPDRLEWIGFSILFYRR